ncbi:MAG TPA: amylo-alpha-1,6-glucosidase, partial [Pirellulales bacterium]|nr:amylo-alpha-1,6-glucosidase [Pirellulales bacterium]
VAPSPGADERRRVLKQGDTFAVFDRFGDIKPGGHGEEGLYHEGTRHLSGLVLELNGERPLYLSSNVKEDNALLAIDLTNRDLYDGNHVALQRGSVHLLRVKFLWQGRAYERLRLRNFGRQPAKLSFAWRFAADYADIFEVRGTTRHRRGESEPARVADDQVVLAYRGLDGVVRRTCLQFSPAPHRLTRAQAVFEADLAPGADLAYFLTVSCEHDGQARSVSVPACTAAGETPAPQSAAGEARAPQALSYDAAMQRAVDTLKAARQQACEVTTSNERFNDWLNRSIADLDMMITETRWGRYPYAGVPWFSTPFGRDGIITALEYLWLAPSLARGVLSYLAQTQASEVHDEQDAEPGKILHETRGGEMAALGEVPFARYYGSVDSTPLFVLLAAAYYQRTADRELIESLWPHIERALAWMRFFGDADGDGFIEYARHSSQGLVQQGWKDSHDSVFHADGSLAKAPIALCEVQGYAYAAQRGAARLAAALGKETEAAQLARHTEQLREKFEQAFWCDELGTYAMALDGDKQPCRVRSSNAGHCLYTGIAHAERARRVAAGLLSDASFSGWGIRTIAAGQPRYNPMSYHNGSVWPHDNALIAKGLARFGLKQEASRILTGLFDASLFVDLSRLPELFCGFPRRPDEGPTLYPVACLPQSWAAAAVFLLLQACMGLRISAPTAQIQFLDPMLPRWLDEVRIRNLQVGPATVDLLLRRHAEDVAVNVLSRKGGAVRVMVEK